MTAHFAASVHSVTGRDSHASSCCVECTLQPWDFSRCPICHMLLQQSPLYVTSGHTHDFCTVDGLVVSFCAESKCPIDRCFWHGQCHWACQSYRATGPNVISVCCCHPKWFDLQDTIAGEVLAAANPELHAAALQALDFGPEDIDMGAHVSYSSVTGPGN